MTVLAWLAKWSDGYSSLGGRKDSSEDSDLDWRWGVISQWYSFAGVIMGSCGIFLFG